MIFRIPTPVFGAGLIEQISDSAILANLAANGTQKRSFGIGGRVNTVRVGTITGQPNVNGNDERFPASGGRPRTSRSSFFGEAYNVEMGISNELFPSERNQTACQSATPVPNDVTNPDGATPLDALNAIEKFALFMRFLAPRLPRQTRRVGRNPSRTDGACLTPPAAPFVTPPPSIPASQPSRR